MYIADHSFPFIDYPKAVIEQEGGRLISQSESIFLMSQIAIDERNSVLIKGKKMGKENMFELVWRFI